MSKDLISAETKLKVEFYDVDSMKVVYHGNYVKFLEVGRCALLDKIGYNYNDMENDGYLFPVTKLNVKYVKPLVFNETITVKAFLLEYENYLGIRYEIFNGAGILATKAETSQMAVKVPSMETQFVCPRKLIEKVRSMI